MTNDALDMAVAQFVRQMGLATAEQVADALKELSRGADPSLADVLVRQGLITAAQKELVEKKAQAQKGATQLQHYKLLKKLGEGGMGAVYLAEDTKLGRKVAVKVLPKKLSGEIEFLKRFRREAEAAETLKHPNIVGAYAVGEDAGWHFYVMEYCEGETLDAALKRDGALPVERAIDVTLQAARGLQFAHERGIIHRDVKPANILVARDGAVKILDLGLSKNLDQSELSFKTVSGAVLGTPHYISPEQAQGLKEIDGRTDLYSLGATLYHLLTGATPFDGTTIYEILSKQVSAQLPNPQDLREEIPDSAVHVIRRMMAKDPDDRYRDCAALIADLEQLAAGKAPRTEVLDPQRSAVALVRKARRRSTLRRTSKGSGMKTFWIVGGIAAALLLGFIAFRPAGRPVEPARPTVRPPVKEPAALPASPEEQARRVEERLRQLNPGFVEKVKTAVDAEGVREFSFSSAKVKDLSPVASLTHLRLLRCEGHWNTSKNAFDRGLDSLSALGGLKLRYLSCGGTLVRDLKPLAGMPLEMLDVGGTEVADLRPLQDMPLEKLWLSGSKVSDLSPLGRLRLREVAFEWTEVQDLRPLKDMPLEVVHLRKTKVTDLQPLAGKRLRQIRVDQPERYASILRSMPLEKINDQDAGEFWKRQAGLVGFWTFDEGKGEVAADASLRGHAATLVNAPRWSHGVRGSGVQFDGTEAHVELPFTQALGNLQDGSFTLVAWYKPLALPDEKDVRDGEHALLLKQGHHTGLNLEGSARFKMQIWLAGDRTGIACSKTRAVAGRFYHVAGVVDRAKGRVEIYVDGKLEEGVAWDGKIATRAYGKTPWRIGVMSPGWKEFRWSAKGILDEARMYSTALTAADVKALFEEESK